MRIAIIASFLLLAGCGLTPQGDAVRAAVSIKGAEAADGAREDAVWYLCNAATVGSIRRWLGGDGQKMAAWNILCEDRDSQPLVVPGVGS